LLGPCSSSGGSAWCPCHFGQVDPRIDAKFVEVHEKIDAVDASLRVEIRASREEMRQGFARVNQVLENHEERIVRVEREFAS